MKKTTKVAVGGMTTALSVALMFSSSLIPFMTYAIPAVAGALLMVVVEIYGYKWAWMIYGSVGFLSLLMVMDKEAGVMYTAFFGYYPIVKGKLDHIRNKAAQWVLKFFIFNIAILAAQAIVVYVLLIPLDDMLDGGKYGVAVLLGLVNVMFLTYEFAMTQVMAVYRKVWQPKVKRMFHI